MKIDFPYEKKDIIGLGLLFFFYWSYRALLNNLKNSTNPSFGPKTILTERCSRDHKMQDEKFKDNTKTVEIIRIRKQGEKSGFLLLHKKQLMSWENEKYFEKNYLKILLRLCYASAWMQSIISSERVCLQYNPKYFKVFFLSLASSRHQELCCYSNEQVFMLLFFLVQQRKVFVSHRVEIFFDLSSSFRWRGFRSASNSRMWRWWNAFVKDN